MGNKKKDKCCQELPVQDNVRADPCHVGQLEPRTGKRICERIRILVEAS